MQISAGETTKKIQIPPSVLNIAKENTYPNPTQDLPLLQPSELSQQFIASSDVKIENPELIHMLNESAISKAPFAFGYRATIYLGHWALNYNLQKHHQIGSIKKLIQIIMITVGEKHHTVFTMFKKLRK